MNGKRKTDLEERLDTFDYDRNEVRIEDRMIQDFYAMLGAVRGLIGAMADTKGVISQINWDQWATERF
jgi:hypothetical protein